MRQYSTGNDKEGAKGAYMLLIRVDAPVKLRVGRLGTFVFAPGWYAYVGSALGTGGLPARLGRHLRTNKRTHWHVDYLLTRGSVERIWWTITDRRLECAWAQALQQIGGRIFPPRFGASDCRCAGHLIYFARPPTDELVESALQGANSDKLWFLAAEQKLHNL